MKLSCCEEEMVKKDPIKLKKNLEKKQIKKKSVTVDDLSIADNGRSKVLSTAHNREEM